MEYQETYHGQHIIITTVQQADGWTASAELLDSGQRIPLGPGSDTAYPTEPEARRAALSAAVEAIDRSRTSRGKP
jgi:hypothetical protein